MWILKTHHCCCCRRSNSLPGPRSARTVWTQFDAWLCSLVIICSILSIWFFFKYYTITFDGCVCFCIWNGKKKSKTKPNGTNTVSHVTLVRDILVNMMKSILKRVHMISALERTSSAVLQISQWWLRTLLHSDGRISDGAQNVIDYSSVASVCSSCAVFKRKSYLLMHCFNAGKITFRPLYYVVL